MNPLLNRLFEDRSKSKSRKLSINRQNNNNSVDKVLVPKISTKIKLDSLPQPHFDRKKTNPRVYVGRLPTLNLKTQEGKQGGFSRPNFRNRKLSTSIKDMQGNIFSTQFGENMMLTDIEGDSRLVKHTQKVKPFEQTLQVQMINNKNRGEQQLFQYLKVIESNQQLKDEFCYMNRRDNPYQFYIVDYDDRNRQQYLTVSLRGITYYKDQSNQFYTIRKFSKEIQMYRNVRQIGFFKNYIKSKVMMHWKDKIIRKIFNLKCKYIINHLFSQNIMIQTYLHFLHSLSEDYSGGSFFNFNVNFTMTLMEFKEAAEKGAKELIKSIRKYDNLIEAKLNETIETMMNKFKIEQRVSLKSADKKEKDEAYLPFDSKRRSMKYTQMAKLKQFEGMIYRLIKYTDMVRFNTKVGLIRRCYENSTQQFRNLKKSYENKQSMRFTNWIQININLEEKEKEHQVGLAIFPGVGEVESTIVGIKDWILKQIFKQHRLFTQKKDSMYCQDVQNDEDQEHPTKFQLKYYIIKSGQFELLEGYWRLSLKDILEQVNLLIGRYNTVLLQIHKKNIIKQGIEVYLNNANLVQYLRQFRQQYDTIHSFEQLVEFALVMLKIGRLKQRVRKGAEDKYKLITTSVPGEIIKRCEQLQIEIRNIHTHFKQNPYTVQQYINFIFKFHHYRHAITQIEAKLQKIIQFQEIAYKNKIRIGETAKLAINQVQIYFKELFKRVEEIQENEENDRKKFENMIQDMIPLVQQKSQEMMKEIQGDNIINNSKSQLKRALLKLQDISSAFQKIKIKKQQLFSHQNQMRLGHRQMEMFDKLELIVHYMAQIWQSQQNYEKLQELIKRIGYAQVNELNLQPLLSFIDNYQKYSSVLTCYELLQDFKQQNSNLLRIIKLSQLISAQTLQQEHISDLKKILRSPNKKLNIDYIFSKEGKNKITCYQLFTESNASEIQNQINEIVFLSAQENIVKNQLTQIQEYWKNNKIKLVTHDLAQNQQQILHLDPNEEIKQKLGYYFIMLKNIEASPYIVGFARDKAAINAKICDYLREFIRKWSQVQRQWTKLLPLMTNCPSVKHQSNVFFDFSSVDFTIRKLIRYVSDMSSLRKICDDYSQGRYINMLVDCEEQLKQINITFSQFLQSKRSTYGRFYFLSDHQLISILEHVKDARTAKKYVAFCFNCLDLQLDNELISAFQHKEEVFKLRKAILKGEPEEIFKNIEQNMKNSLKLSVKGLLPKLKIQHNFEEQMIDYPLQTLLIADRIFWTEMSQNYLTTASYYQYKLLFTSICTELIGLLRKADRKYWQNYALRYVQMASLKEIAHELARDETNCADFKWKQQIRVSLVEDDLIVNQFDSKLFYGCEYYPQGEINITTISSTRFLYQAYHSCVTNNTLVVRGSEGQGKRHLIRQAGSYFGVYQKQIICNSRLSNQFVLKLAQGAIVSGAWLSFYQFNTLDYSVLADLLFAISKANMVEYRNNSYLFMLVHHNTDHQQISIYSFNHFAVYEPEKQKICEYLLEVYRFKNSELIANKLMKYMKLIKPFLDPVLGSQFQLVRKVIANAGQKYFVNKINISQDLLIAQAISEQIIGKQRENKIQILSKALASFFQSEYKVYQPQDKYAQKVDKLSKLIRQKQTNIIVLGQRTCKSRLIKQVLNQVKRQSIYLYGEATDNFFTSQAMEYLHGISKDKIIVYDSNRVISQWADLITSGYLFIEGKRLIFENQIIMQFRNISQSSPSFIGRCHILYIGEYVVTKWDKFNQIYSKQHQNYRHIFDIFQDLFGKNLENLTETNLIILANILKNFKDSVPVKNIQRIVVWLLSVIDKETTWNKHYGGKYSDFTLIGNELVPLDPSKLENIPHSDYSSYLLAPSKAMVLLLDATHLLQNFNIFLHIEGPTQSGKSSFLQFLGKRYYLGIKKTTFQWCEFLKGKYTSIRKQGKNILVDLQKEGHKIIVDDLDLGTKFHNQFLRVLIQTQSFRDRLFEQYKLQCFKLMTCSRQIDKVDKFWSNVCLLSLKEINKQGFEAIFLANFNKQFGDYSMNRQVQDLIQGSILRAILIAQDDLSNILGENTTCSLLLGLLRNLLSLPKKQAFISNTQYYEYFKHMFTSKLNEKMSNRKLQWQIRGVYQNIFKVIFNDKNVQLTQKLIYMNGQFKVSSIQPIKQKVQQLFPNVICFNKLLQNIIYLNNQFRCLDNRVILMGKKGTGKKLILRILAKISQIKVYQNLSDAIIYAIHNQKAIVMDSVQKQHSFYQDLYSCQCDKDLQKFVSLEMKEKFRSKAAVKQKSQCILLEKCKKMLMFAILCDSKSYEELSLRNHEILNMAVCRVDQWPAQALLSKYSIQDSFSNMHAQIFIQTNKILTNNQLQPFSLKIFEKYLKLYEETFQHLNQEIKSKITLHSNIHFKFNQSCSMISAWQARVEILKQQIEASIKKANETIIINQLYSFALSIFYKQIKGEEEKYAIQTDELKKSNMQVDKKIILLEKVLKKIEKIVASFQRTELGQLKKIFKTNKLIYFGAQCLCILLGEEQYDEKSIHKILADPNLLMKMKASQILQQRNIKLETKFHREYGNFENQIRSNTNQLAKTLIEWLRSILQYWQTSHELKLQNEKQKKLSESLQHSSQRFKQLHSQVNKSKKLIEQKLLIVEQHQKLKKQKQLELESISGRLSNAQKIIPIIRHEQQETKHLIEELTESRDYLKGNIILSTFTAIYLPFLPLHLKQQLLKMVKSMLRSNLIIFSTNFISSVSKQKIDSLQNLNLYLLINSKLPKLVIDSHRKFINYLEIHAPPQVREKVIEITQEIAQYEAGQIYYSTSELKDYKQYLLIVDWQQLALQERQAIFLSLAEFKKPEYFEVKNDLEMKINRNMKGVFAMKQSLYEIICAKQMKIIQDNQFILQGTQLQKLEEQTAKLRLQQFNKLRQIEQLSRQINEQVIKIIDIFEIVKQYRKIGLQLMLNICRQEGNTIQNFIRWILANIQYHQRNTILMLITISFRKQSNLPLLKQIINEVPLRIIQTKLKKPLPFNPKYWDVLVKLSAYTPNFKKMLENISKCYQQFQIWCIDPLNKAFPSEFGVKLQLSEIWIFLYHIDSKITASYINKLIQQSLPYNLTPLPTKNIISIMDTKFPIIIYSKLEYIFKLAKSMNDSRYSLNRVSKIKNEVEMKRIIWKSMQAKEWFICYDIQNKIDLQMLQNICYYAMNYDKQAGFRVIIAADCLITSNQKTHLQNLIKSSAFLESSCVMLYQQGMSADGLLEQFPLEYQVSLGPKNQSVTNKQIFNKMLRLICICFSILRERFVEIKYFSFKRIAEVLQFIKFKNIVVESNVQTIVEFISKMTSHIVFDSRRRREIQELWEYIVDQSKMGSAKINGVNIEGQNLNPYLRGNYQIIGCSQAHFIRKDRNALNSMMETISRVFNLYPSLQQVLAVIRIQLGRIPTEISHKDLPSIFNYYFQEEIANHNSRVSKLKQILQQINQISTQSYQQKFRTQFEKIDELLNRIQIILKGKIKVNNFRSKITNLINLLKKQHEFILYFNPSLPIVVIDPNLVSNIDLLFSTFAVNELSLNNIKNGCERVISIQYTLFMHQKQLVSGDGFFITNLKTQDFIYNKQMQTLDPSAQVDGIQKCPLLKLCLKEQRESSEGKNQLQNIQIAMQGVEFQQLNLEYRAVYKQWGLRDPRLLFG